MKSQLSLGKLSASLAVAAGFTLGSAPTPAEAASGPDGPRIGSRIYYYFKDLAYGDNPYDRYRQGRAPRPQPQARPVPTQPRQHAYGAAAPAPRYSLDRPAPAAMARPQVKTPPREPARQEAAPDLPYATPPAQPRKDAEAPQAGVGGQVEATPKVTVKPKEPTAAKPAKAAQKEADDSLPEEKPAPAPKEPEGRPHSDQPPAQVVSNTAQDAGKSWQNMAAESPAPGKRPSPPEPKPAADAGATLTGSKTGTDGRVRSPYPPHNELDVTGLPTGSLAMDPTTGKVFRVP